MLSNNWPHPGEPRYGIFAKRQVDSLVSAGLRCDVLFARGFESPLAYAVAALKLLRLSIARRSKYRLVHAHSGETFLPCLLFLRGARIVTFYGDDLLGTPRADGSPTRMSRIKRVVLRQLSRFATATVTQSRQMESTLPKSVQRRNAVIPSGVDPEFFRPVDRDAAREKLG